MARNEEKHYCRLNRMILQQQREDNERKRPTRPSLDSLHSAVDVKKWLPTIKRDIDFYLKQTQVWCYPERKIVEFNTRIDKLRGEYHAFVRKLRQLDPSVDVLPGTERGYNSKRPSDDRLSSEVEAESASNKRCLNEADGTEKVHSRNPKKLKRISLPILESDVERKYMEEKSMANTIKTDLTSLGDRVSLEGNETLCLNGKPTSVTDSAENEYHSADNQRICYQQDYTQDKTASVLALKAVIPTMSKMENDNRILSKEVNTSNPLGLEYDDTSDEDA